MDSPTVTVLMPVYNGEQFLRESLESILSQTFGDFEFLIIDDGSTDNTWNILQEYAGADKRIILIQNPQNIGLTRTLNCGLELARGKYIARMDADDVSLPNRLQKQVEYMELHPEVGVLGTDVSYIDSTGKVLRRGLAKHERIESPALVRWKLFWKCALYHPTVMVRRALLEQTGLSYEPEFETAQDYSLWAHLSHHTVVTCLPDVTVYYRILHTSISRSRSEEQRHVTKTVMQRELSKFLDESLPAPSLDTLMRVFHRQDNQAQDYHGASDLLFTVYRRFIDNTIMTKREKTIIRADLANRQAELALVASSHSRITGLFLFLRTLGILPHYMIWPQLIRKFLRILLWCTKM